MKATRKSEILRIIPLLIAVCLISIPAKAKYGGGSGTAEDPYQIATAADLIAPDDHDKPLAASGAKKCLTSRLFIDYPLYCCPADNRCRNGRQSFILPGI